MAGVVEREDGTTTAFHWKLKFHFLHKRANSANESPEFRFAGRSWFLSLCANGETWNGSVGDIVLYQILCDSAEPEIDVRYSVGIRTAKGGTEVRARGTKTFHSYSCARVVVIAKSELLRRSDELLPRGRLTLTVTLEEGSSETVLKDASVQATVERNVADVSIQTAVEESEACGGKGEASEITGPEKIVEDGGKLWPNGDHTDVILKVRDVEFKAHKTILAARTPVLGAMFQHDTTEKSSGEVSIDDCEPEVFEQLLHFIYKGFPSELTAENASALYVLADKYLVDEVKALCVRCMRSTLCLDTFCDTLTLSLIHREDELLKTVTDFLSRNMIDVMESVQWQRFLHEHTTWANEIQIRAMKLIQARYEKRDLLDQSTL